MRRASWASAATRWSSVPDLRIRIVLGRRVTDVVVGVIVSVVGAVVLAYLGLRSP